MGDTPQALEEAELVGRLRAGDDDAYATLVKQQAGRMLAVARRMLGSEEDAQDVVQEAFLSAFKAIDRFEGTSRLSTWLHRIVVNAALMKIRSSKRRPETPIEELLPTFLEDGHLAVMPAEWKKTAQDVLESKETRAMVRGLIDELPELYRNVLLLRDIEGLDTKETADLLEVSPNAVKIRLHRARLALRTLLDPHMREGVHG
ncbi:MAG: sigma-70 family RNA polymerase sigma factor [Myxococcota bacterium]